MTYLLLYLLIGSILALWGLYYFHRHSWRSYLLAAVATAIVWPIPIGIWLYHQWD